LKSSKPNLSNKPLVEAIFELRWQLQQKGPNLFIDPHYKIFLGRIYDRVINEYPHHEELPTATMPEEFAGHVIQHRFRKSEKSWPLIQTGPGLITLNDTDNYTWPDFQKRAHRLLSKLFSAYPVKKELRFVMVQLRYIDGINFDFEKEDVFSFLRDKMKTQIGISPKLFDGTEVSNLPLGLDFRASFPVKKPKGTVTLKFALGKKNNENSIIFETIVQSLKESTPKTEKTIKFWIEKAHFISDDWFFKIIEGELFERFK
jgi:uncharacterized protein (TIGR04255 family)